MRHTVPLITGEEMTEYSEDSSLIKALCKPQWLMAPLILKSTLGIGWDTAGLIVPTIVIETRPRNIFSDFPTIGLRGRTNNGHRQRS